MRIFPDKYNYLWKLHCWIHISELRSVKKFLHSCLMTSLKIDIAAPTSTACRSVPFTQGFFKIYVKILVNHVDFAGRSP